MNDPVPTTDPAKEPTEEDVKLSTLEAEETTVEPEPVAVPATRPTTYQAYSHSATTAVGVSTPSRFFLFSYVVSLFSALYVLAGTSFLGYVLFDHFLGDKERSDSYFYFDLAPVYVSVIASLIVMGAIYVVSSRFAAQQVAKDSVGLKDWRVYKVAYASFAALLIIIAATVISSLLYIPLSIALADVDFDTNLILVQVIGGLHVLVWIGLLIWQERLVKKGTASSFHTLAVLIGVITLIVLVAIFPIGSKHNERIDHRTSEDLSSIEASINAYQITSEGNLPDKLSTLTIDDKGVQKRINGYKYEVVEPEVKKSATPTSALRSFSYSSDDDSTALSDADSMAALYGTSATDSDSEATGEKSYKLCATFITDTTVAKKDTSPFAALTASTSEYLFDKHKAGEVCFDRKN